ncbi:hypothetical protein A7310_17935 [Bacillus velezensis]|nr:hypothetical protein A7310_17935 [Bacillus velezensis]
MDFFDRMKEYIENNISLFQNPLSVGGLVKDNDISILAIPGPPSKKNMAMERGYTFPFQILVRHRSQEKSYKTCQQISDHLDRLINGAIVSRDGSFEFVTCNMYTSPNIVETTPKGAIYTAMFQAEIYLK